MDSIITHRYQVSNPRFNKGEPSTMHTNDNLLSEIASHQSYNDKDSITDVVPEIVDHEEPETHPLESSIPELISLLDERIENLRSYIAVVGSAWIDNADDNALTDNVISGENMHAQEMEIAQSTTQDKARKSEPKLLPGEKTPHASVDETVCDYKEHIYVSEDQVQNLKSTQQLILLYKCMSLPEEHSRYGLVISPPVTSLQRSVSERGIKRPLTSLRKRPLTITEETLHAEKRDKKLIYSASKHGVYMKHSNGSCTSLPGNGNSIFETSNNYKHYTYQPPRTPIDREDLINVSNEIINFIAYNDKHPNGTPSPPSRETLLEPIVFSGDYGNTSEISLHYPGIRGTNMKCITNLEQTIDGDNNNNNEEGERDQPKSGNYFPTSIIPPIRKTSHIHNILERMTIKSMFAKRGTAPSRPAIINPYSRDSVLSLDTSIESENGKRREQQSHHLHTKLRTNDNGTEPLSPVLVVQGSERGISTPLISSSHERLLKHGTPPSSADFIPHRPVPTTPSPVIVSKAGTPNTSPPPPMERAHSLQASEKSRLSKKFPKKLFRKNSNGDSAFYERILGRPKKYSADSEPTTEEELELLALEIDDLEQHNIDKEVKDNTIKNFLKSDIMEDHQVVVDAFKKLLEESF
ncbi:uncharacterized protein SPAPADRAFT_52068 [Spathaspora passalidarum NRRL Y-27907]|uniref:Uncharacterized protein n=1 Tax=Spathaspora passalidarum (strain NRRL Y-27907 / 11-Y1) TaxID=619300 RepID=G3ATA9_SPAPN|nr:uncharacterized protein SPAPADRAFT_52068 [Spathaspora passalidarum NRRL Y-27907]EGW30872.1 hypothetical protein SPAPADRAFT_52068 [Spathaspora passalidarum NRRL Y-27907]